MSDTKEVQINRELAAKVLGIVDAGLVSGLGKPKPGQMCVEAAVNFAMDRPHGDDPSCVGHVVRLNKASAADVARVMAAGGTVEQAQE